MKTIVLAAGLAMAASAVSAATLDLATLPQGQYLPTTVTVSGATVTNTEGFSLYALPTPVGLSICSVDQSGSVCTSDLSITFGTLVSGLSFYLFGSGPGDNVALSIFGQGNALLGTLNLSTPDQLVNLASYGSVSGLVFDQSSTAAGYGFANFTFDVVPTVPVPASLPLLAGAIAGVAALRRRRKA